MSIKGISLSINSLIEHFKTLIASPVKNLIPKYSHSHISGIFLLLITLPQIFQKELSELQ